ncbi:MAG: DUF3108 domain-containing protein [Nitrospirota bacterium]
MKFPKGIKTPLLVPLALSLIFHILLVIGVSGSGGFLLFAPFSDTPLTAHIVTEGLPAKAMLASPASAKDVSLQKEQPAPDHPITDTPPEVDSTPTAQLPEPPSAEEQNPAPSKEEIPAPAAANDNNQTAPDNSGPLPHAGKAAPLEMLTASKERLYFDLYWIGIYVGKATLEAVSSGDDATITSRVHSAPFISTFYKVEDFAESRIVGGMPSHFRIKQHEGKYRSDKETIFDNENKKITFFNYLKGTRHEHIPVQSLFWDVISGFYYLRTQRLEAGASLAIDVFDSNKFIKVQVNVLGKERLTLSSLGERETIKAQIVLKSEGLFKKTGDIFVWLTDDDKKMPVKVETQVPIGTVVAELKAVEAER